MILPVRVLIVITLFSLIACGRVPTTIPTIAPAATHEIADPTNTPVLPTTRPVQIPSTTSNEGSGGMSLPQILDNLPLSLKQKGIWFADYQRALEIKRAPQPTSFEEFLALSEGEREEYNDALKGLMLGPSLLMGAKQYAGNWEKIFSFSAFEVRQAVSTGESSFFPLEASYLVGAFDKVTVGNKLLEIGYVEESINGQVYYSLADEWRRPSGMHPLVREAPTKMK